MNKRKQPLKDRIIKKLGGYTAVEYQMLKMPLPIFEIERIGIEQIRTSTALCGASNISDIERSIATIKHSLCNQLGEKALEFAKITRQYDLFTDMETYTAEITLVTDRRATDEN